MSDVILSMQGIGKDFSGVQVLNNVNIEVKRKEIHALVGENGAGKSTLMKVLSGVYTYGEYDGDIVYEGKVKKFHEISDSERDGIIIIHQELALFPQLSIEENIFMGNEIANKGVVDWHEVTKKSADLMKMIGLDEDPKTKVGNLGMGKQQLVEIVKALSKKVKLLILDEPTSSLNKTDSDALLDLLLKLRDQGISAILISHKLNEISKVADSITVLRDGHSVKQMNCKEVEVTEDDIVSSMVGRPLDNLYPERKPNIRQHNLFEVKNWTVKDPQKDNMIIVDNVSFAVRKGEVLGISGLMGSGRTELAMSIFGESYGQKITGEVFINDKLVDTSSTSKAIDSGLAYVTEDRKNYGLILMDSIKRNISIANLKNVSSNSVIDTNEERRIAKKYSNLVNIKSSSIEQITENLSGGNQQKVVLSKWLFVNPDVLILDEPTRGIDVGAKFEIYAIINDFVAQGKAVVIISSEMPELIGVTDRICVMNEGRFIGELPTSEASQEKIMSMILVNK